MQVPFKKCLHGCRLNFPDWLLPLMWLFLDALLPLGVGGSEVGAAFGVGFARLLLSCRKLHWSPFEHCLFSSHWQQTPFPHSTPLKFTATLNHCSCLDVLISGVEISQSKFLIYTSLHHLLQLSIIGHRYLLMNFHVVQFKYGFELIRLTYSKNLQTFQNIIRRNL